MAERQPAKPKPRYQLICYEIVGEQRTTIIDTTDQGFVAAVGKITGGVMEAELVHAGPRELQAHLALLIANDKQLLSQHRPPGTR